MVMVGLEITSCDLKSPHFLEQKTEISKSRQLPYPQSMKNHSPATRMSAQSKQQKAPEVRGIIYIKAILG